MNQFLSDKKLMYKIGTFLPQDATIKNIVPTEEGGNFRRRKTPRIRVDFEVAGVIKSFVMSSATGGTVHQNYKKQSASSITGID